jgi:hypothetical protein
MPNSSIKEGQTIQSTKEKGPKTIYKMLHRNITRITLTFL